MRTMSAPTLKAISHAVQIWLFLAVTFVGLVLVGAVHGPWSYSWFFTMGCWAVLGICWGLAARHTPPAVAVRQTQLAHLTSYLIYALYCLPLSSIPLLGGCYLGS